jgi:2-phosphoglycerate kinase
MAPPDLALHVVYGIACAGKSTAALEFAARSGIRTIIHTDYIREVQRSLTPAGENPALALTTHTAWRLFGPATRASIVAGFKAHTDAVATGVLAVASKLADDGFDAVLEGAHFHADVIDSLRLVHGVGHVEASLLTVGGMDELLCRIQAKETQRAQSAPPKQWHEHAPILLAIQDWLIADAQGHGIRVITNTAGGSTACRNGCLTSTT